MSRSTRDPLPKIIVGASEQERLLALASSISGRNPDLAEELIGEMDRARIVNDAKVPANAVRMNSNVEFESDDGQRRKVTLVYPGEADIAAGRISILTPIGTALIGLSEGQSISWTARDGRKQKLTVLSVSDKSDEATATDGATGADVVPFPVRAPQLAGHAADDDIGPGPSAA